MSDTSKAPEQKYSKPKDVYGADLSNVPDMLETIWMTRVEDEDFEYSWCHHRVDDEDIPYVRSDIHAAMQARAEKAEAALGLKEAIVQEERRVRIRAEDARDGLRIEVEKVQSENERLREALLKVETYHREKYEKSKSEAAKYKSDEITDGSVEMCLSDALLHLEASQCVSGLIAAYRTALEQKEVAT